MRNKFLAAIGGIVLLIIVLLVVFRKKASEVLTNATSDELSKSNESVLASLDLAAKTMADTSTMSAEEKIQYEAKIAEENALREELNGLKLEYSNLFGKASPAGSSIEFLKNAISERNKFLDAVKDYQTTTGDSDISDNNFVTVSDINLAKQAYVTQKENDLKAEQARLANVASNWSIRQTQIGAIVGGFIANFKDNGTSLNKKSWSSSVQSQMNSLNDVELVYAEKFFNAQNVRSSTSYGGSFTTISSIQTALNTKISTSRGGTSGWNTMRGRLASLNSRYPVGGDNINQYGQFKF